MTIYIDVLFFLNFVFDFVLLCSINYILCRNVSIIRLIFGSFIGELSILFLFIENIKLLLVLKFVLSVLMIILCFGYKDFKYLLKNIFYFYLVSMLLGGGIYFLREQFSYSFDNGYIYILLILIGLVIYYKYVISFKEISSHYSNYYNCRIFFDETNFLDVNAFLDTGNKLKDPYSNKSIILIQEDLIDKSKDYVTLYVPYNSLNNHGLLTCYKALKIEINGKYCDKFLVGLSNENFYIDGIDCIINNKIMEGLK